MKRYKSIIEKKKKKHDKIVLLAKSKFNSTETLIFEAWNISHDEFTLINKVMKVLYDTKEEIRKSKNLNEIYLN